ncbi:hypothetical protein N8I77_000220 [Diaporthe amygdali]|uniref:Uncharacterized protein n=1 Tax=Phomopsis amygdali TaxID=1214568 RepID=A0AAD9SPC1_PHOAM|nr:hypothetical protein N8I77_000220 [Diaporthe amygdali]
MSSKGSQAGSRPSSRGGAPAGSSSDVSSLEWQGTTMPDSLPEPFKSTVKSSSFKKTVKGFSANIKKAKIKGQPHQSSTAPEQGQVTSIQLLNSAGKKVIETVHILASGAIKKASEYYKEKKGGSSKK